VSEVTKKAPVHPCLLQHYSQYLRYGINEWIKKMWYVCTMEFYSATKKNEILSFTSKWMELKNIMLGDVTQAQKTKNSIFFLICAL
jgi:hypothetical protein